MKTLYLLPNVLDPSSTWTYPAPHLDALIAESEKGGRSYLKRFSLGALPIYLLNEHTKNLNDLLTIPEQTVGLISDAGLPVLADPGANLVLALRARGTQIHALPGPSSILLALMLSGLPAQQFHFHGYLPREVPELKKQLKTLSKGVTHLFIEAPYRNERLLAIMLEVLGPQDVVSIASGLMSSEESVITLKVKAWKERSLPKIDQIPTVFLVFK